MSKDLNKLKESAKELERTKQVSFGELFTESFMKKYTRFSSLDEFFKAGNFVVESQEDFENIPDDEFNKHIKATTKFADWKEMIQEAGNQYALRKLGF